MKLENILIKESKPEDFDNIMEVEKLAFGYDKEAKLTADLLTDETAKPIVSLLAFYNNEAVGHILFTRAYFADQQEQPVMHILAPLAVKPDYQKKGIGGILIKKGLQLLQERGTELVFVLGHKEYYPKYGFIPNAAKLGFQPPYPMPDEYNDYWMVQPLTENGLKIGAGKVKCSDTLNKPEHWRDDKNDR